MEPPAGVHHIALQVRDLGAVEAFYRQVLGLGVLRRWPADAGGGGGERAIWIDLGAGSFLALERVPPGGPPRRDDAAAGLHLIALRISREARGTWEDRLRAAGIAIFHRTAYTLYLRDPEGNRVGLSHWPEAAEG